MYCFDIRILTDKNGNDRLFIRMSTSFGHFASYNNYILDPKHRFFDHQKLREHIKAAFVNEDFLNTHYSSFEDAMHDIVDSFFTPNSIKFILSL